MRRMHMRMRMHSRLAEGPIRQVSPRDREPWSLHAPLDKEPLDKEPLDKEPLDDRHMSLWCSTSPQLACLID